jgi:hypothetical protein
MRLPVKAGIEDIQMAKGIVARAQERLQKSQAETAKFYEACVTQLGALRAEAELAHDEQLTRFVEAFRELKNTQELSALGAESAIDAPTLDGVEAKVAGPAGNAALAAVAGAGAGALAGAGAFTAVGAFAAAGTGTAISTLSGVAATNATLAFLGGGTLAAGGAGVAGGMMVLGGIVAVPLVAVGGLVFDRRAAVALTKAKTYRTEVTGECARLKAADAGFEAISSHARQLKMLIRELARALDSDVPWLEERVVANNDYASWELADRQRLAIMSGLAVTLHNVITAHFITKAMTLDRRAPALLKESRAAYRRLMTGRDG